MLAEMSLAAAATTPQPAPHKLKANGGQSAGSNAWGLCDDPGDAVCMDLLWIHFSKLSG